MNANRRRGEIAAELDGRPFRLCLTLGALAELEAAFAADDLGKLVERFSSGKLSALDMMRIIGAGIVSDLLTTTFGGAAGGDTAPRP
jgi:hypothetical protein